MKKVFLFVATMIATCTMAQNVTLRELMTQPFMSSSNVFTSSTDEIITDWQCNVTNKEDGEIRMLYSDFMVPNTRQHDQKLLYNNIPINDVTISTKSNGTRFVNIMIDLGEKPEQKANAVAKLIKNDILSYLGVKMPNGTVSRQYKDLPAPFYVIAVVSVEGDFVTFSYGFNIGQYPNFNY